MQVYAQSCNSCADVTFRTEGAPTPTPQLQINRRSSSYVKENPLEITLPSLLPTLSTCAILDHTPFARRAVGSIEEGVHTKLDAVSSNVTGFHSPPLPLAQLVGTAVCHQIRVQLDLVEQGLQEREKELH